MKRKKLGGWTVIVLLALILVSNFVSQTENGTQDLQFDEQETQAVPQNQDDGSSSIKIGFYGSLSGSASLLGQMGQQGCRLAVSQINNAGGINGKEIRLIEYNDQTDPDMALRIVKKMIEEDNVNAIIGSHTSGNIVKTAELTEQKRILQIGLGTSYTWTNVGNRFLFRATGNSRNYDEALLKEIKNAGHRSIAVYYCSTDYARAGAENLIDRINADPTMQVVWARDNDITQTEFLADFLSMKASGADALVLYATSENAGLQLRQLRQDARYTGTVYAPEAFANIQARQEADNNYVSDLVFTCTSMIPDLPSNAGSDTERDFLESYIEMYGTIPTAETAYRGYDAMMILAETFRTAKSFESEDLREALLAIDHYVGIGGTFDFSDGSGDGLKGCRLIRMKDAENIEIEEYTAG